MEGGGGEKKEKREREGGNYELARNHLVDNVLGPAGMLLNLERKEGGEGERKEKRGGRKQAKNSPRQVFQTI